MHGTLPSAPAVTAEIVQLWRLRQRWHRAEKALTLQAKAICRSWTGGDKELANAKFKEERKGKGDDATLSIALMPFLKGIHNFEPERKAIEKRLEKLVQGLPVYPWAKAIKGFGKINLAAVIGECGEISSYRNPSCLWMRMGLGVIDGGRQRKVADAEAALVHGYSPRRRAVAFLLGDCLIRAKSPYKAVYDDHKANKMLVEGMRPIVAHRMAARYMVKRVLVHLWIEARRIEDERNGRSCGYRHDGPMLG